MKQKLVLSFTAQALSLALYRAAPTNQSGGAMGWLLSLLESSAGTARAQPLAQVDVALDSSPTSLSQAMDQAWLGLQHKLGGKLQGIVFEAQLGQAYARLDLLELAEGAQLPGAVNLTDTFLQAWAAQRWQLDPATQVIRSQVQAGSAKRLVSCVDRVVLNELEAFARQHQLRFMRCRPALLDALDQQVQAAKSGAVHQGARILVWTEQARAARRSPVVQLLRFEGAQLQALWRGWLPPEASADADDALEGAKRRFLACHGADPTERVHQQHWPARPFALAAAGVSS